MCVSACEGGGSHEPIVIRATEGEAARRNHQDFSQAKIRATDKALLVFRVPSRPMHTGECELAQTRPGVLASGRAVLQERDTPDR
jgi:hypothetical protein